MMKTKNILLTAIISLLLMACNSDDIFTDEKTTSTEGVSAPILFSSAKSSTTRADITGADAAALLGKQFVVSGYKGANTAAVSNIVFDNYAVKYTDNTAHTSESNTTNWEYAGVTPIKHATDHGITSQKAKYWDYSQPQYDFIAWSTGSKTAIYEKPSSGNVPSGSVYVSAITPTNNASGAYTFEGTAVDLKDCYISNITTIAKAQYSDNPVKLTFRQLGSKVRIALYESVPGYSVRDVQFYSGASTNDASASNALLFTTSANDIHTEGTYTVYFPTVDATSADNNQAHVSFTGKTGATQSSTINWGPLNYTTAEESEKTTGSVFLGRSSATASYAGNPSDNYYAVYLPNENGTNLNLRVNYTLESTDGSGEVITVKGATAHVPSIYTQWKPSFAYTYIFKISDKTNGHTGPYDPTKPDDPSANPDPTGLYPFTFDAVVVDAEDDATQESITLVSTPSITTYQKGSEVVSNDQYRAADGDIYVTVSEGNSASTPDLANGNLVDLTGKVQLYQLSASKTEAEVIDALSIQDDDPDAGTIKGRSGLILTETTYTLTNTIVSGPDGNDIVLSDDDNENKALKLTPSAATYAFVYTKTSPTTVTPKYEVVTKATGENVDGLFTKDGDGNMVAASGTAQEGVTYYDRYYQNNGVYCVKVIKVE